MYNPSSTSSTSTMLSQQHAIPISSNDPSPFDYLLATSSSTSFVPTATVTPVYQYPAPTAEFHAPPLQLDYTFFQSLAPPASSDHPAYDHPSIQPIINEAEIDFQPVIMDSNQGTTTSHSFYHHPPSSSYPVFSSNTANMSISPEISTSSLSPPPPFMNNNNNNTIPLASTQQQQEDHSQTITSSSSTPAPVNESQKSQSSSSSSSSSKTYPCDLCDKVFHRAYNLKSHQLSHSKARPYECRFDACPWRFSRPHDLRRHEQLHAGHRPFGCSTCGKRFAHLEALRRHAQGDTICLRVATMLAHAASITESSSSNSNNKSNK